MADSRTLLKHLKARLREQGITYRELAQRLRLSEPTVKRDLSRGRFSLQRLDRICEVLNLTLEELLEAPTRAPPLTELSAEQEQAIVSKPKLLLVAYLTANDWKFQEIVTTFQISASELIDILHPPGAPRHRRVPSAEPRAQAHGAQFLVAQGRAGARVLPAARGAGILRRPVRGTGR